VKKRTIAIIGAPLDLGAGRRGVDMGPSAVRVAGLGSRLTALGHDVSDLGNVPVAQAESVDDAGQALADGKTPLVLGGDHSIAIGTAAGVSRFFRESNRTIGMLWLDAHADMNTPESSPSGNVHGMPLACCVGMGPGALARMFGFSPKVNPANVALVGIRDVDRLEAQTVRATGVRVFTMREIDERGMPAVIDEAIGIATQGTAQGTAGFHLSFDMDFVDPQYAPGVGTPVRGGATYREAHLAMEVISDSGKMVSMEVVEVNPVIDEVNRTADLAVELILSAMGKKIL
jgi:arginase